MSVRSDMKLRTSQERSRRRHRFSRRSEPLNVREAVRAILAAAAYAARIANLKDVRASRALRRFTDTQRHRIQAGTGAAFGRRRLQARAPRSTDDGLSRLVPEREGGASTRACRRTRRLTELRCRNSRRASAEGLRAPLAMRDIELLLLLSSSSRAKKRSPQRLLSRTPCVAPRGSCDAIRVFPSSSAPDLVSRLPPAAALRAVLHLIRDFGDATDRALASVS